MSYGTNYDTDILETRCKANKLFSRTGLQGTKKNPQKNFSILLSGTKVLGEKEDGDDDDGDNDNDNDDVEKMAQKM